MCFPFSPGKRETHKQFDPHPFPGQSREVVYVYWFFCPPRQLRVFSIEREPASHRVPRSKKLNRGGVRSPGVSHFFRERSRLCRGPFRGLFLVGALKKWPRKRTRTNRENPQTVREQIGKITEKSGKSQKGQKRTKKDKKGRPSPDREALPFETPPFSGP